MARAGQLPSAERRGLVPSAQRPVPAETPSAWSQAPDDEAADMYLAGLEALDAAGLAQYEISNVARPGCS